MGRSRRWLRSDEPKRGPRPAHTLDDIAEACVGLVDREGMHALSMRRVAEALGTSAAPLYRYVSGKGDLLSGWVTNFAAQESVNNVASESGGGAEHLTAMLAHGNYPHLVTLFSGAGDGAPTAPLDNDAAFAAGIDAMLFGIAPGNGLRPE